jgi:hypothetical protein
MLPGGRSQARRAMYLSRRGAHWGAWAGGLRHCNQRPHTGLRFKPLREEAMQYLSISMNKLQQQWPCVCRVILACSTLRAAKVRLLNFAALCLQGTK